MKLKLLSAIVCVLLTTACGGGGGTAVATAEDLAADIAANPKLSGALKSFSELNSLYSESSTSTLIKNKKYLTDVKYHGTEIDLGDTVIDCPTSGTFTFSGTFHIDETAGSSEGVFEMTASDCKYTKDDLVSEGASESEICFEEMTIDGSLQCESTSSSSAISTRCFTSSACSGLENIVDGETYTVGEDWTANYNESTGTYSYEGTFCINGTTYDINDIMEASDSSSSACGD